MLFYEFFGTDQCFGFLYFHNHRAIKLFRHLQIMHDVQPAFAEIQMIGTNAAVMDMKVLQFIRVFQNKRFIVSTGFVVMPDIESEAEPVRLKHHLNRIPVKGLKAGSVFNTEDGIISVKAAVYKTNEISNMLEITIFILFVQIYFLTVD